MPTNLQTLLNAIPTAQDGLVITSDYHNTLKAALLALATHQSTSLIQSYPMALLPIEQQQSRGWSLRLGRAVLPPIDSDVSVTVHGWMGVCLPNGLRIESMTVFGTGNLMNAVTFDPQAAQTEATLAVAPGQGGPPILALPSCTVRLLRYPLAEIDENPMTLISINPIPPGGGSFAALGQVVVAGVPTNQLDSFRLVNNQLYKYVVDVQVMLATNYMVAEFGAVQLRFAY